MIPKDFIPHDYQVDPIAFLQDVPRAALWAPMGGGFRLRGEADKSNTAHMIGQTFGQLTVLQKAPHPSRHLHYLCLCSCGAEVITAGTRLRAGKTKSCGCLRAANMQKVATTHGDSQHFLYGRWVNMHKRCYDPEHNRYYCYGARGIKVCEAWHDFSKYLADVLPTYAPGLTLDRRDNDGDYAPSNFRWATYRVQARNRPSCFISEEDIADMRRMYSSGCYTQQEVAETFGYKRGSVKQYLKGLRA